jgi:hypothetical protein
LWSVPVELPDPDADPRSAHALRGRLPEDSVRRPIQKSGKTDSALLPSVDTIQTIVILLDVLAAIVVFVFVAVSLRLVGESGK